MARLISIAAGKVMMPLSAVLASSSYRITVV